MSRPAAPKPLRFLLTALLLLPVVVPSVAGAAEEAARPSVLGTGDLVPPLALHDQNDAPVVIDQSIALLLLTRDMDGGALVKEALAGRAADVLKNAGAVYLSDVSGMPSFVLGAFALPALRKRAYAVALDTEGKVTAALPHQPGKATVLRLESGRVSSVSFVSTSAEVAAALGL